MESIGTMHLYDSNELSESPVSIGFECLDRDMFKPEMCYDTLGKTGVKHARCQTGWAKCEKEKGVYDFSWLDSIVDNLLSRGIKPWFNVSYGNPLYMRDVSTSTAVGCVPIIHGEAAMEGWKNYVTALCERYKDKISEFEIWNEADTSQFWYPDGPDPLQYAEFVEITGDLIRSIVPGCKIGACVSSLSKFEYVDAFLKSVAPGKLDFFCVHLYMLVPELNFYDRISNLRRTLDRYGHKTCEIWQGESGFPSWFPENHFYHPTKQGSEHQQAVWMLRRFFLDMQAGMKMSSYFQMADMWEKAYEMARKTQKKPAAQGIVNGLTYTPKKACDTISRAANFFSGGVKPLECFVGACYDGFQREIYGIMRFSFIRKNTPMFAYYVPYYIQDETFRKPGGFRLDIVKLPEWEKVDSYVLIDMFTGEVFDIEPSSETDVMLHFRNLPYCDYPMVVCPKSAFKIDFADEGKTV